MSLPIKQLTLKKGAPAQHFILGKNTPEETFLAQKTTLDVQRDRQGNLIANFTVSDKNDRPYGKKDGDLIWHGDLVAIFLQPDPNELTYYEFEINSKGVVFENVAKVINGERINDFTYRSEAKGTAHAQTKDGVTHWTAQWIIPARFLTHKIVRINFYRLDWDQSGKIELYAWSPTYRDTFHVPERFGTLTLE